MQRVAARGECVLGHALTEHAPIDSPGRLDSELCYLTDCAALWLIVYRSIMRCVSTGSYILTYSYLAICISRLKLTKTESTL